MLKKLVEDNCQMTKRLINKNLNITPYKRFTRKKFNVWDTSTLYYYTFAIEITDESFSFNNRDLYMFGNPHWEPFFDGYSNFNMKRISDLLKNESSNFKRKC